MEFGEKIAALRKSRGMTQAELGSELNVTFQAVSKWERGESLPDFATMSKIAKLFGVPLTYFEDDEEKGSEPDGEEETEADSEEQEEKNEKMIGVCTKCGRVVYEGQEERVSPALICKECGERERQAVIKRKKEEEQKRVEQKRRAEATVRAVKEARRSKRNKGFIAGGITAGIMLILAIVAIAQAASRGTDVGLTVLGGIVLTVVAFTFPSQLVWGGAVRTVCTTGGAIIGTPGVIFTLDLDGIVFLIGIKILFAVLKLFVFLITSAALVLVAIVISPFTFVPRLIKVCNGTDYD